jgi:hypothetical protein
MLYYLFEVRQLGSMNINTNFGIKSTGLGSSAFTKNVRGRMEVHMLFDITLSKETFA